MWPIMIFFQTCIRGAFCFFTHPCVSIILSMRTLKAPLNSLSHPRQVLIDYEAILPECRMRLLKKYSNHGGAGVVRIERLRQSHVEIHIQLWSDSGQVSRRQEKSYRPYRHTLQNSCFLAGVGKHTAEPCMCSHCVYMHFSMMLIYFFLISVHICL